MSVCLCLVPGEAAGKADLRSGADGDAGLPQLGVSSSDRGTDEQSG